MSDAAVPEILTAPAEPVAGPPPRRKWLRVSIEVAGLAGLALLVRALAAWLAPAIQNDSLDLLQAAEQLGAHGADALRGADGIRHHPLPALAVNALAFLGDPEFAATLLGIVAGTVAVWPLHAIFRHACGRHAATGACLLYAVLPQALEIAAVPMAEALYVPFFATALALALGAPLASGKAWRWVRFGAAGLAAGAAYLCRPEGLVVGAAVMAFALLVTSGRRRFIAAGLVTLGFLLLAVPYVTALSADGPLRLSPKKDLARFVGAAEPNAPAVAAAPERSSLARGVAGTASGLDKALTTPVLLLALVGGFRRRRWGNRRPRAARLLLLATTVALLGLVLRLNAGWGYGGGRHALGAGLLLLPFAGEGLIALGGLLNRATSRRRLVLVLATLLAMPLAARGLLLSWGRGNASAAALGAELGRLAVERADGELVVASFSEPLVAYYAAKRSPGTARHVRLMGRFGTLLTRSSDHRTDRGRLAQLLRDEQADYVVFDLFDTANRAAQVVRPGHDLAGRLVDDGLIAPDCVAVGNQLAAFRVLPLE